RSFRWIDTICINQYDLDERAQQVSFMRDIYGRAKSVVIWLDEILFELEDNPYFNTNGNIPRPGHADWNAVWWLYRNEWFSRVWVIQQVAQDFLADMLIGDHSVP
ncbi:uncharacterized protein K444DRAFT_482084, partial [Hyaloscypha bicolor E]